MRRLALTACTLPLLLAAAPLVAADDAPRFDPEAVRAHVTFLADDAMEGRDAGSRGYDIAANYVASRFVAMGAQPAAGGSFFQKVPLRRAALDGAPSLTVTLPGQAGPLTFARAEQVLIGPSLLEQKQDISAPLVFAGYGIDRKDLKVDDYRGLDVRGKIVVILTGYPKGMPSEVGAHLGAEKAVMAMKRGAIGVISIPTRQDIARRSWERRMQSAGDPAVGWLQADGTAFNRSPAIRLTATLNPEAAAGLFAKAPKALDAVLAEADRQGGDPRGFALGATARFQRNSAWELLGSSNVVATIPGSDPTVAGEYVVMTAHLDHIGVHGTGPDRIHNGAMDNAAGVATMLEVAQALAKSPNRPRRPILFAAVTGEEKGLVGSDFLARNPVTGAGSVVAAVNFDMPILTYMPQDVIAFGAENSTLGPLVAGAAQKVGLRLSPDPLPQEGLFTRSDHYRFVQQGVPAVFLMTGFAGPGEKAFKDFLATHYHQPSDDMNLPIDWAAGARFAEVNYQIVRAIADAPTRPQWYAGNFFGNEFAKGAPKAPVVK